MRAALGRRAAPAVTALAMVAFGGLAGCGNKPSTTADAGVVEAITPLPPPAGHVGDLYIASPGATWTRARAAAGPAALFLPASFGAVVTTMIGLPVTFAAEIDDAVPVVGAIVRDGAGPVQFALAVHVKSGDRLVDQLTRGESGRFNAAPDAASHVTLFTDRVPQPRQRAALGVLGNYLLVGAKPADLYAIAPYAVRTLGPVDASTMGAHDVVLVLPEKALAGAVTDAVKGTRDQAMQSGPVNLLPFSGIIDTATTVLGDSSGGRCTLNLDAALVHARCAVTPKPGGAAAKVVSELLVGDAKPILALPDKANAAVLWREAAGARADSAPKQADALARLLGADTSADDKAAILKALRDESAARGDWQVIGATFAGTGPTAMVHVPSGDADAMKKAVRELVDLTQLASFKKALGNLGVKLQIDKAVVENLTAEVTRVRLNRGLEGDAKTAKPPTPDPKKKTDADKKTPEAVDLLYFVDAGGLFGAAGFDPKETLRAVANPADGSKLARSPAFADLLTPLGSDATFIAVADIVRMRAMTSGRTPPPETKPLLFAAGRSAAGEPWARVDVPTSMLQEIAQDYARRKSD